MSGRFLGWDELRRLRVGLVTALARPHRVLQMLENQGIHPLVVRTFSDHGAASLRFASRRAWWAPVDAWLTTPKCAVSLRASGSLPTHLAILEHELLVDPDSRLTLTSLGSYAGKAHRGVFRHEPSG